MAISRGPKIVTNGLVLALDAADKNSYPGTGTTWTDVSGNANTGTLTNGPTFSNGNGGSIVFDGTNDYVTRSSVATNLSTGVSMEMVFKSTDMNSRAQGFMQYNILGTNHYINFYTSGVGTLRWETWVPVPTGGAFYSSTTLSNNTWYHAIGTYNSNGSSVLYINGSNVGTGTYSAASYSATYTTTFTIGEYAGYLSGNVALARIYNRALSATEVLQNYNATKPRFGL
jgi:hypothetical protein